MVVNVSSVVGRRGIPGQVAYVATKAAVGSIGEGLGVGWAERGVAVCTLEPGLTRTGFFDAQPNPHALPQPPLAAADDPERVARAVLDLARRPRPVRCLRWKWRLAALLTQLSPRLADRRLGGW